jgi:hypothetical protein
VRAEHLAVVRREDDDDAAAVAALEVVDGVEHGPELRVAVPQRVEVVVQEALVLRVRREVAEARVDDRLVPAWNSNLQPDFHVRVFERFDTSSSALLRELEKSDRSVQKSAESISM